MMFSIAIKQGVTRTTLAAILGCILTASMIGVSAIAQCPEDWRPGVGHPGVTGDLPVWSLTTWDPDGPGPQQEVLAAGGGFFGAGDVATFGIATWDGATWSALGENGTLGIPGMNDQVMAVTVYNGDLIAAGFFTNVGGVPANRIARWDGKAWHALGGGLNIHSVRALAVYNGELYAGGQFNQAGGPPGVPAPGIARWNGSSWQDVAGSVTLESKTGGVATVFAMTVFDGKLIVGGGFTSAGGPSGVAVDNLASWDGSTWQSMDGGVNVGAVEALAVYNGDLITGGGIQSIGNIAQWNPQTATWQSLGGLSPSDRVFALREHDGDLYVGGVFTNVGGMPTPNCLARWNGTAWSAIPSGPGIPARRVRSFTVFDGDLIAGGLSTHPSGVQASEIGRFDSSNQTWHTLGGGINGVVVAVASFHGDVFVGGQFFHGEIPVSGIARRGADGTWDSLDGGVTGAGAAVLSMVEYDDGLVVSGSFTMAGNISVNGIAMWDGTQWKEFSTAFASFLFVHDGELYGTTGGGVPSIVSRWNPATKQWIALGALPQNVVIRRLAVWNRDLVAAGIGFNGAPSAVYRWDGASWHPMGAAMGFNAVEALIEYNGELIAGGTYDPGGGGPPGGIIKWNPATSSWQTLAGGLFDDGLENFTFAVSDFIVFDGDLFVVGAFSHAGEPFGVLARDVVRWNGSTWSAVGAFGGANNQVLDVCAHNDGLLFGGWFTLAGGSPNGHFARWGPVCPFGDVTQDGSVDIDDLLTVINSWGVCAPPPGICPADVNSNGVVDIDDLLAVINNWG